MKFIFEGAFWGLISGLIIGLIRFIWEFSYSVPSCEFASTDRRPTAIKFHFLYFAILLFGLTCLVATTVSLLTRPIPEQCVSQIISFNDMILFERSLVIWFEYIRFE